MPPALTHRVQKILNLLSAVIMLVGLGSAILIYQTARDGSNDFLGYENGSGETYPVMPEDSKAYTRNLEVYGGKANVLATGLRRWFVGLWHGKALAFTVAALSILISFGFLYAARCEARPSRGSPAGNNRHGPG
jgi:hypothetical protein